MDPKKKIKKSAPVTTKIASMEMGETPIESKE